MGDITYFKYFPYKLSMADMSEYNLQIPRRFQLGELSYRPVNQMVNIYQGHRMCSFSAMARGLGMSSVFREFMR
jgi:hypothetical protein